MRYSMSLTRLLLLTVAGITMIAPTVFAGAPDAPEATKTDFTAQVSSDQSLADQVMNSIRRYSRFGIFDWVTVEVEDGIVLLDGSVREPLHRSDYEKIATRVPGVSGVENTLDVQPLSNFDDQIRLEATRALNNNAVLQPLMRQSQPSIHVIVMNGRIWLEGVVRTPLDRELAAMTLRQSTRAFGVVNNLQVENT